MIGKAKAYRGFTRMDADQEKPKPGAETRRTAKDREGKEAKRP